jgi:SpoVK/Ycf46/Vps4 family AAA+-type ATPase
VVLRGRRLPRNAGQGALTYRLYTSVHASSSSRRRPGELVAAVLAAAPDDANARYVRSLELCDDRRHAEALEQPWDVDAALRRPGRFDRTVLVLPPDAPARSSILEYHLRGRPVELLALGTLVAATDGYSGADLAHLCETAAEKALVDSVRRGVPRMIGMADFEAALREVRPSTGPWFTAGRGVAMFANECGVHDDLLAYLRDHPDA